MPSLRRQRQAGSLVGTGLDALERRGEPQVDAVVTVQGLAASPDERADGTFQGNRERLDHDHVGTEAASRRRHLEADEAGSRDRRAGHRAAR